MVRPSQLRVSALAAVYDGAGALVARRRGPTRALRRRTATGALWRIAAHGAAPGRPAGILHAWPIWERIARRMWPTMPIPGARYRVLDLQLAVYGEPSVALDDGVAIEPGTLVVQLHCNNPTILRLARARVSIVQAARDDLHHLARWIAAYDRAGEIKALYGVTVLGSGCVRLGFTLRPRALPFRNRMDTFFMNGLLLLYNPDGLERAGWGILARSRAQQIWMSRAELLRRYLAAPRAARLIPDRAAPADSRSTSSPDDGCRSVR